MYEQAVPDLSAHNNKTLPREKTLPSGNGGAVFPIRQSKYLLLRMMYRNLSKSDRAAIAREFYSIPSREYIENWIHCSVVARNIAAHGARFYHRKRIPKDVAENLVVNAICENILRPDTLEDLADAIAAAQQADVNQPDPPDVKIGTTIFSKKAKK